MVCEPPEAVNEVRPQEGEQHVATSEHNHAELQELDEDHCLGNVDPGELRQSARGSVAQKFGGPVDVVAFGSSHRPGGRLRRRRALRQPWEPDLWQRSGRIPGQTPLGTVGVLDLDGKAATSRSSSCRAFAMRLRRSTRRHDRCSRGIDDRRHPRQPRGGGARVRASNLRKDGVDALRRVHVLGTFLDAPTRSLRALGGVACRHASGPRAAARSRGL